MEIFGQISFWAVFLASIVYMLVGAIWYSPFTFGKLWVRESHLTQQQLQNQTRAMPASWLSSIVMGYVLAYFMLETSRIDLLGGLWVALLAWAGFVASTWILNVLYSGRSIVLFLLDTGYRLVALLAMAATMSWYGVVA